MNRYDNAMHAHRHAHHAFEDFEAVRRLLEESPGWTHEIEQHIHAISHHLRHAVYRTGLGLRWHDRMMPIKRGE